MKTKIIKWAGKTGMLCVYEGDGPLVPVRQLVRNTSIYTPGAEHADGWPARRRWYQMQQKALKDAATYGTGVTCGGKHVPLTEFYGLENA